MLFKNKEDYKDNSQVYNILTALEIAHTKQDRFTASLLLTRLAHLGIKIVAENDCQEVENLVQ